MSFVPREERARRSRQAQFANGQRPGGSDVDPRQRRSSEAELQTSQRVGDGQEVDANGRAQVRKDNTITVDSRNRHAVVPDNLRFVTPTDGTQAANKDYVDAALADLTILGDSEYVAENSTAQGTSAVTVWTSAGASVLSSFNNVVSPTNASAVYAILTHTGTGDTSIQLAPGYYYELDTSLRCYNAGFEIGLAYSPSISATSWNSDIRTIRFGGAGTDLTTYAILDNTAGSYTYITPRFRRFASGTTQLSSMRLRIRRLMPHYKGAYEALPLPPPVAAPVAEFEGDPLSIAAGGNVQFANLSTGHVHTFLWDFGDGTSGPLNAQENPLKTYALAGTYTVSLTVTGDGGSDTETKTSYITVT